MQYALKAEFLLLWLYIPSELLSTTNHFLFQISGQRDGLQVIYN